MSLTWSYLFPGTLAPSVSLSIIPIIHQPLVNTTAPIHVIIWPCHWPFLLWIPWLWGRSLCVFSPPAWSLSHSAIWTQCSQTRACAMLFTVFPFFLLSPRCPHSFCSTMKYFFILSFLYLIFYLTPSGHMITWSYQKTQSIWSRGTIGCYAEFWTPRIPSDTPLYHVLHSIPLLDQSL